MSVDMRHSEFSDKWGVLLSSLCFFHCLGAMLLIPFAPFFYSALPGLGFHFAILPLIVLSALTGLVGGYKRHRTVAPLLLGLAGVALVGTETMVEEFLHHSSLSFSFSPSSVGSFFLDSHPMAAIGSLLLVAAHLYNVRLLRLINSMTIKTINSMTQSGPTTTDPKTQSRNCLHPLC
jgi:MerC mercury resistance protein